MIQRGVIIGVGVDKVNDLRSVFWEVWISWVRGLDYPIFFRFLTVPIFRVLHPMTLKHCKKN